MKVLVQGKIQGTVLKSENPINFLGTVEKKSGVISEKNHDLFNKSTSPNTSPFSANVK